MQSHETLPRDRRTAAQHLVADVPVATPDEQVEHLLRRLRGHRFTAAVVVAVLDGERLVGLVPIEAVLAAPQGASVSEVMDPDPPTVEPGTDQEPAAWRAVERGESTLAVVDDSGRFHGVVPASTLLAVLLAEHDEDLARLGGFAGSAASARSATVERVSRRLRHRLPWLVVGLAGALLAAGVVGRFEETIREQVLIAYFLPGVVYLADAVGTQTEALVIRGLSLGVGVRRVVGRELLTGVLLGGLLGVVALLLVWGVWADPHVALAVALSVAAASCIATLVALALPWLFNRLGSDPAFGSGPLATVVQDLVTVAIYFVIAAKVAV